MVKTKKAIVFIISAILIVMSLVPSFAFAERKGADIEIRNEVEGSLGNREKGFWFYIHFEGLDPEKEYKVSGDIDISERSEKNPERRKMGIFDSERPDVIRPESNGDIAFVFRMKDRDKITFHDMDLGASYIIREEKSDHMASYEIKVKETPDTIQEKENEKAGLALETKKQKIDGNQQVFFTNERRIKEVKGITEKLLPFGIMIGIAPVVILVIIAAVIVIRGKRK